MFLYNNVARECNIAEKRNIDKSRQNFSSAFEIVFRSLVTVD